MRQRGLRVALLLMAAYAIACGGQGRWQATAQDPAKPAPKAVAKETPAKETTAKPAVKAPAEKSAGRRLPVYFADVVTQEQREKIYTLNESYAVKIQVLVDQLKKLRAEQMAAAEALLTPEQLEKLNALRKAAEEKRQQRVKAAEEKAATEKTTIEKTTAEK